PAASGRGAVVDPCGRHPRDFGGRGGGRLSCEPRLEIRPDSCAESGMMRVPGAGALSRLTEGVGVALDSLRSNKARAALTILGVAIGVTVVIGMGSAITGINHSITSILESAGPKTFFVQRYFSGGLEVSDGSDEMSPWRRMPWITTDEADMIRRLP